MPSAVLMSRPLPMLDRRCALFLDLDGTLSRIAPTPGEAVIEDGVLSAVAQIQAALKGAVAVVSGRPVSQIDEMCYPWHFTAAGQHGLEVRHNDTTKLAVESTALAGLRQELAAFHAQHSELLLEYKGSGIAVHYRQAPELQEAVMNYVTALMPRYPDFFVQHGKMVCEIRLKGADKGTAINLLMLQIPFAAKIPVFIGDDTTDEDGFQAVNALHGISVKVGAGPTVAKYCVASVDDIHTWLVANAAKLSPRSRGVTS